MIKINALVCFAFLFTAHIFGQADGGRLLVLNEGRYNYQSQQQESPVSISVYLPAAGSSGIAAVFEGLRFASDMLISGEAVYVAVDSQVLKLDRTTLQVLHRAIIPGCRKLHVWNDQLLVSIGHNGNMDRNLVMLDQGDLGLVYSFPKVNGTAYAADRMIIIGRFLYLALNNGFDTASRKALIDVIDLEKRKFMRRIKLPDASNVENLMWDGRGRLITVNNHDYSRSSISIVDLMNGTAVTKRIIDNNSCTTSALVKHGAGLYVFFQEAGKKQIGRFDLTKLALVAPLPVNVPVYAIASDQHKKEFYLGVTDYVSYGKIYTYTDGWQLKDSATVGISPGVILSDKK